MRLSAAFIILIECFGFRTEAEVSFSRQIAPILLEKCVTCHGPEKAKGGFRLDTFAGLMAGGESKKASIRAGLPAESHVVELLTTKDEDDRMPQKSDRLPDAQIALIRQWITEGAKFDGASRDDSLAKLVPYQPGPEAPAHYPFPQAVLALAWSVDGKTLASSGYHEALLWNTNGSLAARISRLPQRIHGLAFIGGDQLAIAAGTPGKSGEVLLRGLNSSEPPRLLTRLPDEAIALAVNSDQTRLAAGGSDNSIHVFDLPSGKELFSAQQHADWVTSLAFSPDGTRIASASRDRTARVFDAKDGNLLETYPEHLGMLFAVAFSSDGKRAFSGGREKTVHAWQVQEAKKTGTFQPLDGDILAICVAGNRVFVSGGEKSIHEFNADSRKQTRSLMGHQDWVYSLAFHATSSLLASGGYDGEIRVWNSDGVSVVSFKASP
jgi:WD40 repeat protein